MAKNKGTVTYYQEATAKCLNCGSVYTLGMSLESINLEICAHCHPYYTGNETLVDTAGRIEKFEARLSKASSTAQSKKKTKTRKIRAGLVDISFDDNVSENQVSNQEE